jgi:hypothetical protein
LPLKEVPEKHLALKNFEPVHVSTTEIGLASFFELYEWPSIDLPFRVEGGRDGPNSGLKTVGTDSNMHLRSR